jgi:hypothetical protein
MKVFPMLAVRCSSRNEWVFLLSHIQKEYPNLNWNGSYFYPRDVVREGERFYGESNKNIYLGFTQIILNHSDIIVLQYGFLKKHLKSYKVVSFKEFFSIETIQCCIFSNDRNICESV